MATIDETKQALIDAIHARAEAGARHGNIGGDTAKSMAEALVLLKDESGPQVY